MGKGSGVMDVYSTAYLKNRILHSDDLADFKNEILSLLQSERDAWKAKVAEIIAQNGYSKESFAKACQVSRPAVFKWCEGALPSSRNDYIRIGFAAHYTLDEMNTFLQRYGRYPALYAKSLEDSVYIYVLNSDDCPHTYDFCCETIVAIKEQMQSTSDDANAMYETTQMSDTLMKVQSVAELTEFIQSHAAGYRTAYAKFYAYVNAFLIANNINFAEGRDFSVQSLANAQEWTSSLRQSVSAIRQKKWFPLRRKVIALGLHLNMTAEQINEMLTLAQMEPLCAKNPVESAIIFAVEDADLNDMICCDGGTELCEHVKGILESLGVPDASALINDL